MPTIRLAKLPVFDRSPFARPREPVSLQAFGFGAEAGFLEQLTDKVDTRQVGPYPKSWLS